MITITTSSSNSVKPRRLSTALRSCCMASPSLFVSRALLLSRYAGSRRAQGARGGGATRRAVRGARGGGAGTAAAHRRDPGRAEAVDAELHRAGVGLVRPDVGPAAGVAVVEVVDAHALVAAGAADLELVVAAGVA